MTGRNGKRQCKISGLLKSNWCFPPHGRENEKLRSLDTRSTREIEEKSSVSSNITDFGVPVEGK
jgi:hypothetical protein